MEFKKMSSGFSGSTFRISAVLVVSFFSCCNSVNAKKEKPVNVPAKTVSAPAGAKPLADSVTSDTILYNSRMVYLAHEKITGKWPVKTAYPLPGAILPYKRIVAFYGNFYSAGMGILGELTPDSMLNKLNGEVKNWEMADSVIPVLPAIHYIAVTAQKKPGQYSKYRLRMPFTQIDKALMLARKINGILILDVQVGHSTLEEELPLLEPYFKMPDVHLGIDPEYSMKGGEVPCSVIGTFDAADVNYAASFLADIVVKYNVPPKVLVVHRFTKEMVTNYKQILTRPEVQIVMNMDGFGFPAKKRDSYKTAIVNEPVQFAGFKLFYKNDILSPGWKKMMQPAEVIQLYPAPIYIQYQ